MMTTRHLPAPSQTSPSALTREDLYNIGTPLFSKLSPMGAGELAAAGQFVELPRGAAFANQGECQDYLAILLDGQLAVSCYANGVIIEHGKLGPGDLVGEMNIIDPIKASATVKAVAKTSLWQLPRDAFEGFLERHPKDGLVLFRVLATHLCHRLRKGSEAQLRQSENERSRFLDMDY